MRNIIEALYYGNICPMDRQIVKGGDYSHLLHLLTRNEDNLTETLTQAQQEIFGKYKDCVSELNEANEGVSIELDFESRTERQRLIGAIEALGKPDSELIVRKYLFGQSSKEIGERLGLTASNVDTRTHRAIKKLRESFGGKQ